MDRAVRAAAFGAPVGMFVLLVANLYILRDFAPVSRATYLVGMLALGLPVGLLAGLAVGGYRVAVGRLDGFWEENLKPWDTAAGAIIVLEAGGKLSTCEGRVFTPYLKSVVACTPMIHGDMVQTLSG